MENYWFWRAMKMRYGINNFKMGFGNYKKNWVFEGTNVVSSDLATDVASSTSPAMSISIRVLVRVLVDVALLYFYCLI